MYSTPSSENSSCSERRHPRAAGRRRWPRTARSIADDAAGAPRQVVVRPVSWVGRQRADAHVAVERGRTGAPVGGDDGDEARARPHCGMKAARRRRRARGCGRVAASSVRSEVVHAAARAPATCTVRYGAALSTAKGPSGGISASVGQCRAELVRRGCADRPEQAADRSGQRDLIGAPADACAGRKQFRHHRADLPAPTTRMSFISRLQTSRRRPRFGPTVKFAPTDWPNHRPAFPSRRK